jgi:hypothetical protein
MAPTSAETSGILAKQCHLVYERWCIKRWFGEDKQGQTKTLISSDFASYFCPVSPQHLVQHQTLVPILGSVPVTGPIVSQRVGRDIVLLFHDRGNRRGCLVSSTPRPYFTPGKDPVLIAQDGWASGPVWMGGKSRPTGIRSSDRLACSQSLYRLNYPAHSPWKPYTNSQIRVYNKLLYNRFYQNTSGSLSGYITVDNRPPQNL